jgi:16S rRNA (guanine966-N2)-methyltransferase
MRIIAGSAGGRPLKAPPDGLRPTMDRVRAAVFSSLGDLVPGARCLDLFAGSGAMGIEALSRGAAEAVFVDSNERCSRCIRENLRMAGVEASVQTLDAHRFLDLYAEPASFDLVFADPPYFKRDTDTDHAAQLAANAKLAATLRPGGLLVLEKNARAAFPDTPLFETVKTKRYGGSEILYLAPR